MSNVCDNMVCGEKLECFFVFFKKTGATSTVPIYVGATHLRRLIVLSKKPLHIILLQYTITPIFSLIISRLERFKHDFTHHQQIGEIQNCDTPTATTHKYIVAKQGSRHSFWIPFFCCAKTKNCCSDFVGNTHNQYNTQR